MLNPITQTLSRAGVQRYKAEPYVASADVYSVPPHQGRAGWTWYTGSAGWIYRVGLEQILGIRRRGDTLCFDPCLPQAWKESEVNYRYGSAVYRIRLHNSQGPEGGRLIMEADGRRSDIAEITLRDDGERHEISLYLVSEAPPPKPRVEPAPDLKC